MNIKHCYGGIHLDFEKLEIINFKTERFGLMILDTIATLISIQYAMGKRNFWKTL